MNLTLGDALLHKSLKTLFNNFFCLEFKLMGVSIFTWQSKSPDPLCLIAGIPLPRSLNNLEDCVPAGTLILSLPCKVGTSIEPPSADVANQ